MLALQHSRASSSQQFSLVLFNMNSPKLTETNVTEEKRHGNMIEILDKIVSELPLPIFILCQENLIDKKQHRIWRALRSAGVCSVECTNEAGIICIDNHPPRQLNVQFVSERTLQETNTKTVEVDKEKEDEISGKEIFKVDRLKACTFTLGEKKVLLISWHGPHRITKQQQNPGTLSADEKLLCFRRLIRFSENLRKKESSDVVLLGGDFNLQLSRAQEEMTRFKNKLKIQVNGVKEQDITVVGAVEALYDPPPDRPNLWQLIDYLVYWPKDQLPKPCARPDYRNRVHKGTRPFDHPVIGYRFGDSIFQSVAKWSSHSPSQSAPSSRKIAHNIPFTAEHKGETVRVCLQCTEHDLLEQTHNKLAYKATYRFLPTEEDSSGQERTAALIIGEKDSTTLKKELHDFERQLELLTPKEKSDRDPGKIRKDGKEETVLSKVNVEWCYSSIWKPPPSLQGVSAANTSVFCFWCHCVTGVGDFPRSPDEQDPPGKDPSEKTVLPWMGYRPGNMNELPARNQISYRLLLQVINRLSLNTERKALYEALLDALSRLLGVDFHRTFVVGSSLHTLSGQQLTTIIQTLNLTGIVNDRPEQNAEGGPENAQDLSWLRDVQYLWRNFHQLMQALETPAGTPAYKTPEQFRAEAESWATRFEREIGEQSRCSPAEDFTEEEYLAPCYIASVECYARCMKNHIPEAYEIIYIQAVKPEAEEQFQPTEGPSETEGEGTPETEGPETEGLLKLKDMKLTDH